MSNTVLITVSKTGVFQDWLKDHPDAAVVVEEDEVVEEDQVYAMMDCEDDEEEDEDEEQEGEAGRRTESRASSQSASREDDERTAKLRAARLVKLMKWNPAVQKVGPYGVTRSGNAVRLNELKSILHEMEDATSLSNLERFKKYREDGYLLIKGVYNRSNGGAELLEKLQKDIARLVKKEYGLVLDAKTMEEIREAEPSAKKKKIEVDKTIRVFPELSDDEFESEGDWNAMGDSGATVLNSSHMQDLIDSFVDGAGQFHHQPMKVDKRFSWVRLRGRLMPRKEWSEYYFFRDNAEDHERQKWDKRYARELTRRLDNPKPRYAFSAWVAAGPNPIDGGNMAILPGSHVYTGFLSPPRGEETPFEFKKQAKEMPWVLSDLEAGDVLLVDMQTVRAFVSNRHHPHFIGAFADSMFTMGE